MNNASIFGFMKFKNGSLTTQIKAKISRYLIKFKVDNDNNGL